MNKLDAIKTIVARYGDTIAKVEEIRDNLYERALAQSTEDLSGALETLNECDKADSVLKSLYAEIGLRVYLKIQDGKDE